MKKLRYLPNVVTLEFDKKKCTGCGRCIEVCPHGVWQMKDKRAALVDKNSCIECGACAKNCRYFAIEVQAGVGCAAAVINGMRGKGEICGCETTKDGKTVSTGCC